MVNVSNGCSTPYTSYSFRVQTTNVVINQSGCSTPAKITIPNSFSNSQPVNSQAPGNGEIPQVPAKEYRDKAANQLVKGNYTSDVTLLGTVAQISTGLVNADVPGDIRDIMYDITNWETTPEHIKQTFMDGIGFLPIIGAFKYADEAETAIENTTKGIDDIVEGLEAGVEGGSKVANGAGKYDNIKFDSMSNEDAAKVTTDIRDKGGSPIEIPENATVNAQSKNGYQQVKYKWSDEAYNYEARWHTETPGAAQYDRGATWVVTRTIPGNANGVQKVVEVKVGDSWVDETTWNQAVKANQAGTATEEQKKMLQDGHFQAE